MTPPIHKLILKARRSKRMKQEMLGPLCDCSRSYISKIENGSAIPSVAFAKKLQKALGMSDGVIVKAVLSLKLKEKRLKESTRRNIQNLRARLNGA